MTGSRRPTSQESDSPGNQLVAPGERVIIGFTIRVIALYLAWEEPLAKEPTGVYQRDDGRPVLGRKLAGKPQRELHDLGLLVDTADAADAAAKA